MRSIRFGVGVMGAVALWAARAAVTINEIHHSPDVKTEAVEFVELYNSGAWPVGVGGWRLTDGVEYTIPAGVRIDAGGYLVIAADPQAVQAKFGVNALGPWDGRLNGQGERVEVRDAAGGLVDRVDYGLGFPWPTVGDAPGYSIELLDPGVDNDLGGHWRASVVGNPSTQMVVPIEKASEWRLRKGTNAPPAGWQELVFDDAGWSAAPGPVGYDSSVRMGTPLDDMRYRYVSFFLRREFTVTNAASVSGLALEALYDDGFKAWINGTNVLDIALPKGEVVFDRVATSTRESENYDVLDIALGPGVLREGRNVIAVQVANVNRDNSSDCFFDGRLRAVVGPSGRGPTPGRLNSVFSGRVPPALRQVQHLPRQPRSGQPVVVSVKVTSGAGLAEVRFEYQAVEPGDYIELGTAAYTTNWTAVAMNDAGEAGDGVAGDDVYTVTLPGALSRHRRLVRYRIEAVDRLGTVVRAPYDDDPQPNFAWFCYDGVPVWTGAIRPGASGVLGQVFTVPAEEMNRLPVYHLVARKQAVEDCTWYDRRHGDEYYWIGTLVYDDEVYDHIRFRPRGGVWRYAMGKNMWKFDFNRGHDFRARDDWGRRLGTPWTKLNLGASIQQGDFLHRGEQGLFESVGFRLFQLVGQPAMHTVFVQFRIVDEAVESKPGDQYGGDFWGLYLAIEQPDGRFLEEHGLRDGNFYKMEGGFGDPNNLGPEGPADSSDLSAFMSAYSSGPDETWWRAHLNLSAYYGYQTIVQAIHHYDIADGKNYFYHRDPVEDRWTVVPWDLDLTWADNMYRSGQQGGDEPLRSRLLSNFSSNPAYPAIVREFRNRVREIRDLLWNPDEVIRLIDEHAWRLRGTNTVSLIDADRAQWDYNPLMVNPTLVDFSKAGQGLFYQRGTPTRDLAGMVQLMKNYVGYRATNAVFSLDTIAAEPLCPDRPFIEYTGPAGFPANRLGFRASAFSGSGFGSIRWRVGEVARADHPAYEPSEPQPYEVVPVWDSGELGSPTTTFDFPSGAVRVGRLYRARVRYTDAAGRSSHWSSAFEFTPGSPDTTEELARSLRLSELMYNPAGGSEFEYVELHNCAADAALDLGGVRFTAGIEFTFPPWTLAAGGYLLVVRAATNDNFAAFRSHYGLDASVPIVGSYSGSLANEGETLIFETAAGDTLFEATYGDGRGWPEAADGAGHSLVPRDAAVEGQNLGWLDYGGNWRASAYRGGSPGRVDPEVGPTLILSELMAHTHYEDPLEPGYDSNDWIEIRNVGAVEVDTAGWYLSDDGDDPGKWVLPARTQRPGEFAVFDEIGGFHRPLTAGFGLNQTGESLYLSHLPGNGLDRVADAVGFKGQELAYSWGRHPHGERWWTRLVPSPGQAAPGNAAAPRPLVLSEIHYRPFDLRDGANRADNDRDEFIELHNPTGQPVYLADTNGVWRLDGGIRFLFPTNAAVPAAGFALVVRIDPADTASLDTFRQRHGVTATNVVFFGPFEGRLGNGTDRVGIEKPLLPDRAGESAGWVVVEETYYSSGWPWPRGLADGGGHSLQRVGFDDHAADPQGWQSAWPTAGAPNFGLSRADFDGDGLPDWYEVAFGVDPADAAGAEGAEGDRDADGLSNAEEFLAGTDPGRTTLQVVSVRIGLDGLQLRFNQPAQQPIRLERGDTPLGPWTHWRGWPAGATARILTEADADATGCARFYRLVSP